VISASLSFLLQQSPEAHYQGGAASGLTAGATTDPVATLFRFLLSSVPQSVQIAGIFIGGPVALIVAWQVWKHRRNLWAWFLGRSRAYKLVIAGSGGFVALIVGFVGLYNYNYVMHKNDFCQSCHIMDTAWNRFQVTAHKDLQCHACHRQPLWVSSKELFWWVFERRMAIPAHDKVPTAICSECHLRAGTDSARTNVLLTAGHVVHMKSDTSALKDVQCVSCHGRDFHMFRPNNATCAQGGCHAGTKVKLGAMSQSTFLHCTTCHQFRTRVPEAEPVVAAKRAIAPRALGCSACHEMAEQVLKWDLAADPHNGSCGSCHDPHKQDAPRDAYKSCTNAGCHASADTLTAFHKGLGTHALDNCGACHQAHSWKVRGTDCLACHKTIFNKSVPLRRGGTAGKGSGTIEHDAPDADGAAGADPAASRIPRRPVERMRSFRASVGRRALSGGGRRAGVVRLASWQGAVAGQPPALPGDSLFRHARHRNLACTTCHATTTTHGALKISVPGGCLECHHAPAQTVTCVSCHPAGSVAAKTKSVAFAVSARATGPVTRPLSFEHTRHASLECAKCHGSGDRKAVTTTCTSCHADHHSAARDCASCHPTARTGHDRTIHDDCATCHSPTRFTAPAASRTLCVACHPAQRDHYPARECASCHVLPAHAGGRGTSPR
jgi:hypothetical protein